MDAVVISGIAYNIKQMEHLLALSILALVIGLAALLLVWPRCRWCIIRDFRAALHSGIWGLSD